MRKILFFFTSLFFFLLSCNNSNEDPVPMVCSTPNGIFITAATTMEGVEGDSVLVTLELSDPATAMVTAYVSTRDISALAGEDYIALDLAPVVFEVGETFGKIAIQIIDDEVFEEEEKLEIKIEEVEGAEIVIAVAVVTITNDDDPLVDLPTEGYTTPEEYPNRQLIWQDEFSDPEVSSDWTFEIGNGSWGWGNNELEFYRKENTSIFNGHLVIEAKEESFGGFDYTSSRMITRDAFDFQYGRVDIRAVLPIGQGIWPALWMLGSNITTVGWPACGEIDIMELVGHQPAKLHGTAHWARPDGSHAYYSGDTDLPSGTFQDRFHVFSIEWTPTSIRWLLDDVQYHVIDITPAELSELRGKQFFIFNVAVGGNWPGSPDATTVFPQQMIVDYIRVFQ